jgi:hypothetical protein
MSPKSQRIAIAEASGWAEGSGGKWHKDGVLCGDPLNPPDYLTNLDAIREAVATLKGRLRLKYAEQLMDVCGEYPIGTVPCWDTDRKSIYILTQATAKQRAEAFLKTIGKWGDLL